MRAQLMAMAVAATTVSGDALLNATVALAVGLSATLAAIGIAIYQRRQNKSAISELAAERKRADDAVARLEAARSEELRRAYSENEQLQRQIRRERKGL